jgi:nicotinic acid phosphoribosyltransferase
MEKPTFISGSRLFRMVTDDESKSGHVADVYFRRTMDILATKGLDKHVAGEVRAGTLPNGWPWGVLPGGIEESSGLSMAS